MFTDSRAVSKLLIGVVLSLPAVVFAQPDDAMKPAKEKPAKEKPAKATTPRVRGTAYVRILHAIKGAGNVDVYVDGGKKVENVTFGTLSDYLTLPSGARTVAIKKAGTNETVAELKKTATRDKSYVIAAVMIEGAPGFLWQNEVTGKLKEDKAAVRIYHFVPGVPMVQVTTPAARGADKMRNLAKDLEFGKNRLTSLNGGTASLQIRVDDKLLKEAPATVENNKRYAAFVIGDKDNIDIVVAPAGSPDAPPEEK